MNLQEQNLYNELMALSTLDESFSYNDEIGEYNDEFDVYRVFTYRLSTAESFTLPSALECRGIMFRLDKDLNPVKLVCRPQTKFFNLNENPQSFVSKDLPFNSIKCVMKKLDGSIINSYIDLKGKLKLKSHTKLDSPMAISAYEFLTNNSDYFNAVLDAENKGYTVNFELTSPSNCVILFYPETKLTVLNVRNRLTGEMIFGEHLKEVFPDLFEYSVQKNEGMIDSTFPVTSTVYESALAVRDMPNIEGFIIVLEDGRTLKVKSDWYCWRHRTLDAILTTKGMFFMVLTESSDDCKQLLSGSPETVKKIEEMENFVKECYNGIKHRVEEFYNANKHLSRKDYAAKIRSDYVNKVIPSEIKALFSLYEGSENDYTAMMKKDYRDIIY